MRAAIYARVSTNNGQDPHMQTRELREYCNRRGLEIAGEYVDAGVSGVKEHRPQLDALLGECRKRCVDAVVVYRYDRFARSLRQLVNALEEFRSLVLGVAETVQVDTVGALIEIIEVLRGDTSWSGRKHNADQPKPRRGDGLLPRGKPFFN